MPLFTRKSPWGTRSGASYWLLLTIIFVLPMTVGGGEVIAKAPPWQKVDSALLAVEARALAERKLEKIDPRAFDLFINGMFMEYSGDLLSASQLYERALDYFATSYEIRFSLAAALYNMRRPGESLDQIKKLSKLDGPAYGLAAACYRALNDPHNAAVAYQRQVQFDSTSVAAFSYLSGYYRTNNKPDSSAWAYQHLLRLLPESVQLINEYGRFEAQRGNLDSAISAFRRSVAAQHDTTNASAIVSLSETYEMKDQLDSATALMESAVAVSPEYIPYRHTLINLYARMDSVRQALPHALFVARKMPADHFAARRLGILYFSMDSLTQADSIFSVCVKAGDEISMNYYYLGQIELRRKEWKKAVGYFEHMTRIADTSSMAWISLSAAYNQLKDTTRALASLRTGIEKVRDEKQALNIYYALGSAYEQFGMVDSARATFEDLLTHAPNFAQALNYLGYMFADKNMELDSARTLIQRALDLEPDNGAFLDSYGWVLYRMKEYREALSYLMKAADAQPDPTVFEHLGDVYHDLNLTDSAHVWWKKALELMPNNDKIKDKLHK